MRPTPVHTQCPVIRSLQLTHTLTALHYHHKQESLSLSLLRRDESRLHEYTPNIPVINPSHTYHLSLIYIGHCKIRQTFSHSDILDTVESYHPSLKHGHRVQIICSFLQKFCIIFFAFNKIYKSLLIPY